MRTIKLVGTALVAAFMFSSTSALAVPSFARDTGKNCSYCHNAWPQLNKKGRDFKEMGYLFPDTKRMAFKDIAEENTIGVSAIVVARPYDKKGSASDFNLRALHEVEVIVAGAYSKNWSGFFELEAEDEDLNAYGFTVGVPAAVLTYSQSKALNVQFTWGPTMWADSYGMIGDHFRLTRGHVGAIDQKFGGSDSRFRSARQNIAVTGRPMDNLFYSVGLSGQADGPKDTTISEGKVPATVHARIAFDATKDIMVGGFIINGSVEPVSAGASSTSLAVCTGVLDTPVTGCAAGAPGTVVEVVASGASATAKRSYSRIGLDAQADLGDTRVQFLYIMGTDDNKTATAEEDNDAMSLQAYHVFKTASGAPTWVPLVRIDTHESSNGTVGVTDLTLNVTRYFEQNVKGYIEYFDTDSDNNAKDDDRVSVQLAVGF